MESGSRHSQTPWTSGRLVWPSHDPDARETSSRKHGVHDRCRLVVSWKGSLACHPRAASSSLLNASVRFSTQTSMCSRRWLTTFRTSWLGQIGPIEENIDDDMIMVGPPDETDPACEPESVPEPASDQDALVSESDQEVPVSELDQALLVFEVAQ